MLLYQLPDVPVKSESIFPVVGSQFLNAGSVGSPCSCFYRSPVHCCSFPPQEMRDSNHRSLQIQKSNRSFYWLCSDMISGLLLSLIHISEPTRRTPISYAVFCLKKK